MNWVEAVDQENSLREPKRTEFIKDGIKTVTDYVEREVDGVMKKQRVWIIK